MLGLISEDYASQGEYELLPYIQSLLYDSPVLDLYVSEQTCNPPASRCISYSSNNNGVKEALLLT